MLEGDDLGLGGVSAGGFAGTQIAGSASGGLVQTGGVDASGGAQPAGANTGGAANAGASAGGASSAGASTGGASTGGASSCLPTGAEVCDGLDNDCNGQVDDGNVCPCPAQVFGGRSYLFCSQVTAWLDARQFCAKQGYHLASIRDGAADRFLSRNAARIANARWWVGLNDRAQEGRFVWEGGTPVGYLNWAAGEPNDTGGNEDCVELNRFGPEGGWNDEPCEGALPFVCESGGA